MGSVFSVRNLHQFSIPYYANFSRVSLSVFMKRVLTKRRWSWWLLRTEKGLFKISESRTIPIEISRILRADDLDTLTDNWESASLYSGQTRAGVTITLVKRETRSCPRVNASESIIRAIVASIISLHSFAGNLRRIKRFRKKDWLAR